MIIEIIFIILGLCLFEVISSLDNAVINAEVLATMSQRSRRWFLTWGIIIAVFFVRGFLPFLVLWMGNPSLGFSEIMKFLFSSDPAVAEAIEKSAPILLVGGGTFLMFLFFHWIFLEPKNFGLKGEGFILKQGVWFYAVVSVFLAAIVWISIKINPLMSFGAVIGSTAFFITHGFKENAAKIEENMIEGKSKMSDTAKLLYLEVIDATFSIDGVLGAFAFTFVIPLILIGNGLGAIVLRQLTVKNIDTIRKYRYLKNGAMYSIFALGLIMIMESFGAHVPTLVTPLVTFAIVAYFFWKSVKEVEK